jgi:hypothetical protein
VKFYELLRDGKAHAQTMSRTLVTCPVRFEDVWKQICGNTPTGIANRQHRVGRSVCDVEPQAPTGIGVPDSVDKKI